MGEKKRRLTLSKRFIRANPLCCYCGGASETLDEIPPRAMFWKRRWPEGLQFPACEKCNKGRSPIDVIFSFHVKCGELRDEYIDLSEFQRLGRTIRNRFPEYMPDVASTPNKQQKIWEAAGFKNASKLALPRIPGAVSPEKVSDVIESFLLRLTQALYWKEIGEIIPRKFLASITWVTNTAYLKPGEFSSILATMTDGLPIGRPTKRGNIGLSDQFFYRWGRIPDEGVFCFFAQFGTSMSAFCFAGPEEFFYRYSLRPHRNMDCTKLN